MEPDYLRFFWALAFTLGLIWAVVVLVRRLGLDRKLRGVGTGAARLRHIETLYIGPRQRITLVRADSREYLLGITGDRIALLEAREGGQ